MITRGADELIYAIPNFRLDRVTEDPGIPIAPWRGVGPPLAPAVCNAIFAATGKRIRRLPIGRIA